MPLRAEIKFQNAPIFRIPVYTVSVRDQISGCTLHPFDLLLQSESPNEAVNCCFYIMCHLGNSKLTARQFFLLHLFIVLLTH